MGFSIGPPRIFEETDLKVRLWIIESHPNRWRLVMWVGGLQPMVTAIGFLFLSAALTGSQSLLLLFPAAGAIFTAGVLAAKDTRANIADPVTYLDRSKQPWATVGYILLTAVAGILYGIIFLQTDLPSWLGYTMLTSAAIVPLLVIFKRSVAYAVIMAFNFVTFVAGMGLASLR